MERSAFTQGIRPGGLTDSYEVTVLVCYILDQTGQPLTAGQLEEAVLKDGLANYFEFAQAFGHLQQEGHIIKEKGKAEQDLFRLSEKGALAARNFYDSLPASVRQMAGEAVRIALLRQRREKEILTEIEKTADGYKMTIRMTDIGSDLLSVSMFLPTKEECEAVQKRFRSDPAFIYQSILALCLGEKGPTDQPVSHQEKLYD
ncbi:MAG: DUF4364 family protein [Oscillospiraceae bacterium]|nr:DUF4364 family protein [Oscillospiraceae bacterium]